LLSRIEMPMDDRHSPLKSNSRFRENDDMPDAEVPWINSAVTNTDESAPAK
jgi:hypothetical protein